jgi:predicted N-formylglutamate amidohydrolase
MNPLACNKLKTKLIISCEHAVNSLPAKYSSFFKGNESVLSTHRAYDIGAIELYETLVQKLNPDFCLKGEVSRLLIELNRSLHHPQLFSDFTKSLSKEEKEELIANYYRSYRSEIEHFITSNIKSNFNILHISVHSFTNELKGIQRNADLGILYDPKRVTEKKFAKTYKSALRSQLPSFKVRFNYPYLGTADGFTSYLRKKFPQQYLGIELELNNSYATAKNFREIQMKLGKALEFCQA